MIERNKYGFPIIVPQASHKHPTDVPTPKSDPAPAQDEHEWMADVWGLPVGMPL